MSLVVVAKFQCSSCGKENWLPWSLCVCVCVCGGRWSMMWLNMRTTQPKLKVCVGFWGFTCWGAAKQSLWPGPRQLPSIGRLWLQNQARRQKNLKKETRQLGKGEGKRTLYKLVGKKIKPFFLQLNSVRETIWSVNFEQKLCFEVFRQSLFVLLYAASSFGNKKATRT